MRTEEIWQATAKGSRRNNVETSECGLVGPKDGEYQRIPGTRRKKAKVVLHVLTMIDPATRWFECVALKHAPTADKIHWLFDKHWLARYP